MAHEISQADRAFRESFESGKTSPAEFDHRAHLRLAYIYLAGSGTEEAYRAMRAALYAFLDHHSIDVAKYHDTLTRAWVMAVRHFMERTRSCACADELIDRNPELLDSKIMLTHYSSKLLFSEKARSEFVEPDIGSIPRYDG